MNDNINEEAARAVSVISVAAENAARVIANSAAEALKITNVANTADHDLLIRLETKMESLKVDIRDLKDVTNIKVNDHELRISALEKSENRHEGKTDVIMPLIIAISTIMGGIIVFIIELMLKK